MWPFRHRAPKPGPWACRGMIGHRWVWIPARLPVASNVLTAEEAKVACGRCGTVRAIGTLRGFRAALRRFATFTDGPRR